MKLYHLGKSILSELFPSIEVSTSKYRLGCPFSQVFSGKFFGTTFFVLPQQKSHSYPDKNHLRKGRLTNLHSLVDDLRDASFCPDGISILHNAVTMGGADFAVDDPNPAGPKLGSNAVDF